MDIQHEVVAALLNRGLKLATAESCTGGLIAKMITDVSGSSGVFECGIVSYANRIKHSVLGVSSETLERFGAVSEQTAREMAAGALKVSGADLAVAVTGIAGPESDGTDKPVGLVYIALSDGKNTIVKKCLNGFSSDVRENNRRRSAEEALNMVLEYLKNE